jgi:hypothetical protein
VLVNETDVAITERAGVAAGVASDTGLNQVVKIFVPLTICFCQKFFKVFQGAYVPFFRDRFPHQFIIDRGIPMLTDTAILP